MALPNFFIIGAAKAGTTSLHYYLSRHPEVQMSATKEPNFFSGPPNGNGYPLGRVSELDAYEALFDSRYRVRGEASVGYSNYPRRQGVPAAIKELVPDAKFIYMVRDPVARTVSQYRYRVAMEGERRPIEEALADLADPFSVYLCPSRYGTQLDLYLREFAQESILVVDQADLLSQRPTTLREIFDFLEVDTDVDFSAFEEELNAGDDKRTLSPGYVRLRERVKSSPLRLLPRGARRSLRGSVERILWRPVPAAELDEELRRRLEELYAPEVEQLRRLTGKAFPSWSI